MADGVVDLDADGVVRRRPDRWECDTDSAMIGNYYDVAMLDPLELADGYDGGPGTTIDELRIVDHRDREAWQAILRPTAGYDPRCPRCSLLLSALIEAVDEPMGDELFPPPRALSIVEVPAPVLTANCGTTP